MHVRRIKVYVGGQESGCNPTPGGFGSVKWWKIFNREQCDAINRFVCFFTLPFFTFEFAAHVDPFDWNYKFIGADAISKVIIVIVLAAWAKCSSKGSYCWSITSFSLATLTNSLVVGVPMFKAMYGEHGVNLVVQSSVVQGIVWLTILLFVLEFRKARSDGSSTITSVDSHMIKDLEGNEKTVAITTITRPSFLWHFEMPSIMEGSILIMSKAGIGSAMFSMGLFVALQEKILACGTSLTVFGMILRFIAGPAAMAIGSIAVGLHGDVLRVAIIQAALPQSITSFIYAKEYGLHADVLSTAVIFGLMVSLPVLIGYYIALGFLN
ncbi:Auxin efflux carrier [Macleaya cordata]|uniref:Auxin efflux carrier n=1 Tax=Macleaya cordata TaxID=56857 RepID=A0A200R8P9_MACCD|nr:Auxin efflux carrier [Macleaya cordata]